MKTSARVRVARDEVRGLGVEDDDAAVGRDGGVRTTRRPARPRTMLTRSVVLAPVADEDVGHGVRVAGTRFVAADSKATNRPSFEIDPGERRSTRVFLDPGRADAHAVGRAELQVAHEDVLTPSCPPGRDCAPDRNATKRPSAEIPGSCDEVALRAARARRSRARSRGSGDRGRRRPGRSCRPDEVRAAAVNATKRPSAEIAG